MDCSNTQVHIEKKKKRKRKAHNVLPDGETKVERKPLEQSTNLQRNTMQLYSSGASTIAAAVAKIASINASVATPCPRGKENCPDRISSASSVVPLVSEGESFPKQDVRLSESERVAFEAEKMHLRTLLEAQQAEEQVRELQLRTAKEDVQRKSEKLQRQLQEANRKVHDLSTAKHDLELDLIHVKQFAQDLEQRLDKALKQLDIFKSEATTCRVALEDCHKELTKTKADKMTLEKRLQKEICTSTKLSALLNADPNSGSEQEPDPVSPPKLRGRLRDQPHHVPSPPYTGSSAHSSPKVYKYSGSPTTPSTTHPHTPRAQRSMSATYTPASCVSANSEVTQCSSKSVSGTAPVVYNEPKNKEKQYQYAAVLEQQIEESRSKKRRLKEENRSQQHEYYPFGRPGSGAPVRDQNSNVITTRRKSLPENIARPLALPHM